MPLGRATLAAVLRAALLAGVVAALTAAVFHYVATEPVIDQAIALEEQLHPAAAHQEPVLSRETQRVGLFIGFLGYGLSLSLLFAVGYHAAQRWLPGRGFAAKGAFLALAVYWAVCLFPFAKYPANPPGVGDPETIGYRQILYFGFLALSLAATALAIALGRSSRWRGVAVLVVIGAAAYAAMPPNPDPVRMPADLMLSFRGLSLAGLTLFWVVFGGVFSWRVGRAAVESEAPVRAVGAGRA
jgi:predicted cobalt transporter CbtA